MKIEFSKNLGEVYYVHPGTEKKVTVFITEDINADAIESLVAQYNAEYSMTRIKGNMEQDERLTGDEVDYIVEQLCLFDEGIEQAEDDADNEDEVPGEMYIVRADDENGKEVEMENCAPWSVHEDIITTKVTSTIGFVQPGEIERVLGKIHKEEGVSMKAPTNEKALSKLEPENAKKVEDIIKEDIEKKKVRQPRQPRTAVNATGTTQKTISPQEYIKKLQERIELIKIVDNVITKPEMEVINAVSGEGRKLLLEMSKELDEVVTKYLELIQTL